MIRKDAKTMIEYRFGAPEYRADIIDFINHIFSQAHCPHNFATLLPKVYGEGRGHSEIHAIVLEDGRLRGVVGQLPMEIQMAGCPLKIGYIGSVSTHPDRRGAGYMIQLMDIQARHAKETGLDIMMLGGQRQRYEYYGYSPVGEEYRYSIGPANVRHALKSVDAGDISFRDFAEAGEAAVDAAYALYRQLPVTGARSREDFDIVMRSWNATPYAVLRNGKAIGYCVADGKEGMSEIVLAEADDAPALVKAWFQTTGTNSLHVSVPAIDGALNRQIASFAESYSKHGFSHVRIVNLKNVVKAALTLKKALYGLPDGEIVLQMEEETPVGAFVKDGNIEVEETNQAPHVKLARLAMQQYLFGGNRFMAPPVKAPVDWFPLPLYLYPADHF